MSAPVLNQVNLVVRDMRASIAFYRRLGVAMEESQLPEWAPHHASAMLPNGMRLELDSVEFARQWNPGLKDVGSGAVFFFGVESREEVDRLFATMTASGYKAQKPPEDAFWGARYAIIDDPDGNPVGLMSAIDPAMRKAPPPPPGERSR